MFRILGLWGVGASGFLGLGFRVVVFGVQPLGLEPKTSHSLNLHPEA